MAAAESDGIVVLLRVVTQEIERERRAAAAEIDHLRRRVAELEAGVERLLRNRAQRERRSRRHPLLTDRELDILELLAMGFSEMQMAERLGIARRTLKCHQDRLYRKLDVHSNVNAARYAWRNGIVSIDEAWTVVESMQLRPKTPGAVILPREEPPQMLKLIPGREVA